MTLASYHADLGRTCHRFDGLRALLAVASPFRSGGDLTVGAFRDWLLDDATDGLAIVAAAPGITPETAAAVLS